MIIAVIGSGGREHSICKKISESPKISKIYCLPGNAGTSEIAENIEIDINNLQVLHEDVSDAVMRFMRDNRVNEELQKQKSRYNI